MSIQCLIPPNVSHNQVSIYSMSHISECLATHCHRIKKSVDYLKCLMIMCFHCQVPHDHVLSLSGVLMVKCSHDQMLSLSNALMVKCLMIKCLMIKCFHCLMLSWSSALMIKCFRCLMLSWSSALMIKCFRCLMLSWSSALMIMCFHCLMLS